jgi:hypothetical protein
MTEHPIQQSEPPVLHQRLDEVVAQLKLLQQSVATLHGLQQTLLQEVQVINAAQSGQADKLEQVKKEIDRVRWWRRFAWGVRLLMIGALVATALYFLADWQAFFQFFVAVPNSLI